ncbi:MAG: hypothetical protein AAFO07_23955 [Bacteroidota bacterium]
MLKKYFDSDVRIVLAIIIVVEFIYNYLLSKSILSQKVLYNSLATEMTLEQIDIALEATQTFSWVYYISIPLAIIASILLISLCLNIGSLLLNYNFSFKSLFNIVTKSYIIYTIGKVIMLVVLNSYEVDALTDLAYLPRFSVYDFFDADTLPSWAIFPLQLLSVFELIFILLLATGLNFLKKRSIPRWVLFVLATYGLGMLIVSILVIFLVYI